MRRLRIDVPDDIATAAKARAKAAGKSLSSYLADLVARDAADAWPEGFFEEVVGGWKGEPLVRPEQGSLLEFFRSAANLALQRKRDSTRTIKW